jgi:hypothetical protein
MFSKDMFTFAVDDLVGRSIYCCMRCGADESVGAGRETRLRSWPRSTHALFIACLLGRHLHALHFWRGQKNGTEHQG